MSRRLGFLWVLGCLAGACGPEVLAPSSRAGLTQVTSFGSNPGGLTLWVHLPPSPPANPALVVALHGCTQSASAYEGAGWDALADQYGFIVAYPQTTGSNNCFDWYDSAQETRSGPQVTSILQMVQALEASNGVDPGRVYVTGLSAGGAMTDVLLATVSDVFSRGAVMAGLPFACATTQSEALTCMSAPPSKTPAQWAALVQAVAGSNPAPRVSIWHGDSDFTVRPANQQEEMKQWTAVNGIDVTADRVTTVGAATRSEYRDSSGTTLVETWTVAGMAHGTPVDPAHGCGTAGAYILDVGVCSSLWAAEFFGLAPPTDAGTVLPGDGGSTVSDGGSSGPCTQYFDTNVNHFVAHRAVLCGGQYCAVGSGDQLGGSLTQTWLRQTSPGYFQLGQCSAAADGGAGGGSGGSGGGAGGGSGGGAAGGGSGGAGGSGGGSGVGATHPCEEFYDFNSNHIVLFRAFLCAPDQACSLGYGTPLGLLTTQTWLNSTQNGYFDLGRCPVPDAGVVDDGGTGGAGGGDGSTPPRPCGCSFGSPWWAAALAWVLVLAARRR